MIIERANLGRTTVLIVDEAHNLDWDVLEEIRLLGNLENRRGKMFRFYWRDNPNWTASWKPPISGSSSSASLSAAFFSHFNLRRQ